MAVGYNPKIVTNGLAICLDAANVKSYPGSGTNWTDLSGNGNNGTLVNGVSYSNGALNFDGTDDYVSTTTGTYTPYCVDIWFYNDDNIGTAIMQGTYQMLCGSGSYPGGITLGAFTGSATNETFSFWSPNYTTDGMTYIRDTAAVGNHNIVVNWNGSTYDIWLDGIKRTTYAITTSGHCKLVSRTGFFLGSAYNNSNSYEFDGRIYYAKVYTSQLTDDQIQQNFDAIRGRYGI